jgi:hypothetical protein
LSFDEGDQSEFPLTKLIQGGQVDIQKCSARDGAACATGSARTGVDVVEEVDDATQLLAGDEIAKVGTNVQ